MLQVDYVQEVYTVVHANSKIIGFMCRRSVVFGCAQEIPDGWIVTRNLWQPEWKGNFPTRKEARDYLLNTCGGDD